MSAEIYTLPPRRPRAVMRSDGEWTCVLLAPDVTVGALLHALRGTGLVLSNDAVTGVATIHRRPTSPDAA